MQPIRGIDLELPKVRTPELPKAGLMTRDSIIKARAKERQKQGGEKKVLQLGGEAGQDNWTDNRLAKMAGTSHIQRANGVNNAVLPLFSPRSTPHRATRIRQRWRPADLAIL
jgi:hypothetical protein